MHPLIDRIRAIRREQANHLWEPISITLGWVTCDALNDELKDVMPYGHRVEGVAGRGHIMGFHVIRDTSFPLGGVVTLERPIYLSPYERQTEHLTVPL